MTNEETYINVTQSEADTIKRIARNLLGIEHLEERKMDDLDVQSLAVWQISTALEAAYEAGKLAADIEAGKLAPIINENDDRR